MDVTDRKIPRPGENQFVVRQSRDSQAAFKDDVLTDAETRVAKSVARGFSNKQIAAELGLSVRTIENHISHILAKKAFTNRVELARYVFQRDASG